MRQATTSSTSSRLCAGPQGVTMWVFHTDEGKSHSSTQLLRSSEKDEIFDEWSMEREGPWLFYAQSPSVQSIRSGSAHQERQGPCSFQREKRGCPDLATLVRGGKRR